MGECLNKERMILIKEGLSVKQLLDTLSHEVLHAIAHCYRVRISHRLIYDLERVAWKVLFFNLNRLR